MYLSFCCNLDGGMAFAGKMFHFESKPGKDEIVTRLVQDGLSQLLAQLLPFIQGDPKDVANIMSFISKSSGDSKQAEPISRTSRRPSGSSSKQVSFSEAVDKVLITDLDDSTCMFNQTLCKTSDSEEDESLWNFFDSVQACSAALETIRTPDLPHPSRWSRLRASRPPVPARSQAPSASFVNRCSPCESVTNHKGEVHSRSTRSTTPGTVPRS
jgi:hypothetical protein